VLGPRSTERYSERMRTVVLDPPSAGLGGLLEQRRISGLDRLDEVWEGVLHMVPAPGFGHAILASELFGQSVTSPPALSCGRGWW